MIPNMALIWQVRHLLALLSEERNPEQISLLIAKVDANHSGDIEFEELVSATGGCHSTAARGGGGRGQPWRKGGREWHCWR